MGTATSSRAVLTLVVLALVFAAGACGSSGKTAATTSTVTTSTSQPAVAFAWLRPVPAPAGWRAVTIPTGATLGYPPGWHVVAGDKGTATAALFDAGHHFLGYLNLTPRQAGETVANWTSFRVRHNAEEGDRHVKALATGRNLRFRSGRGACVRDSYTTTTGSRYIEIACLVAGRRATSVIVGAAPPRDWATVSPLLERAISAFTT